MYCSNELISLSASRTEIWQSQEKFSVVCVPPVSCSNPMSRPFMPKRLAYCLRLTPKRHRTRNYRARACGNVGWSRYCRQSLVVVNSHSHSRTRPSQQNEFVFRVCQSCTRRLHEQHTIKMKKLCHINFSPSPCWLLFIAAAGYICGLMQTAGRLADKPNGRTEIWRTVKVCGQLHANCWCGLYNDELLSVCTIRRIRQTSDILDAESDNAVPSFGFL